jgi:hypothetical protein
LFIGRQAGRAGKPPAARGATVGRNKRYDPDEVLQIAMRLF